MGAVLVGGRSSRFGSDKAAALFEGRRLLDHAAASIAPFVERVVTVGRDERVPDLPAPGLGPLGGIAGALAFAEREGFESVLTIACDMPRLPEGLIADLLRRAPAWCIDAPVLGHWPASLAAPLMAYLEEGGDRSVRRWARSVGALPVASPVPIPNVNTLADLAAL